MLRLRLPATPFWVLGRGYGVAVNRKFRPSLGLLDRAAHCHDSGGQVKLAGPKVRAIATENKLRHAATTADFHSLRGLEADFKGNAL